MSYIPARSLTDLNRKKIKFFLISVQSLILTIIRQQMQRLSYGDAEDEDEDDDDDDDDDDDTAPGLERSEPHP